MGLTKGQQKCVETLDVPLVVAAGAGSGKTFTLTKRIVEALKSGVVSDIDEVCAITFTKKAAAELKSRIKGELRACGLLDQALKVDGAWISTIHGMCARILRSHAVELGVDPAFKVVEGAQVNDYLSRAVDAALAEAQRDGSEQIDALFEAFRARSSGQRVTSVESMLFDLVREASSHADGIRSFVLPGGTIAPVLAVEQALGIVEGLIDAASAEKESASRDEWLAKSQAHVAEVREAFKHGVNSCDEAYALIAPFSLSKKFGSKGYKAHVDEACGKVGALVMEMRLGMMHDCLQTLVELAARALELFTQMKRDDGVLDNNDLLVLAAHAIEEYPAIAEQYVNKFKLVMVDEFQDTDQMQVDMIKRLSGEGACRLCTVGDAQQSIYRFRGADVSVYRRHLESIRAEWPDSIVELSDNFRSHADVLSFVDRVFERPGIFDEFMSLAKGRDEGKVAVPFKVSAPRIMIQHTSQPWRGVDASLAVETAAQRIAKQFAAFVEAGHSPGDMVVLLGRMTHADVYAQALRDKGLSCVISGGSVFADTLEANVVCELVRVIANPRETQALFNVLTSPLFGLTASDLLAVGGLGAFWDKAQKRSAVQESWSPRLLCALRVMGNVGEMAGIEDVSRMVEAVALDSGWLSRLEREGAEGLASAGNVFKAIRMLKDIEQAGATGPTSVMRKLESELVGSKEAPGALSVAGGNSVRIMTVHASKGLEFPIVAVAEFKGTNNSSSGLLTASIEGKTYLSLDVGNKDESGGKVDVPAVRSYVLGDIADEGEAAGAVLKDQGALHRRLALSAYLDEGDAEEAKRLLYVALTRAKEAIVVSTMGKCTKDNQLGIPNNAFKEIFEALEACGATLGEGVSMIDLGGSMPAVFECKALQPDESGEDGAGIGEEASQRAFMVPAADEPPSCAHEVFRPLRESVFSYSSIADASHEGDVLERLAEAYAVSCDAAYDDAGFFAASAIEGGDERAGDDFWDVDPSRAFDEDRATNLGTAFHRLAQYAVAARSAGMLVRPPEERIVALSRTCNLDSAQRERLVQALDRWFGCDLAHEMAALPALSAEVPFFVHVGDAFLEGEIDLIGFDAERKHAFVVDYKTGGSTGESGDELRQKHVLQAACYAYAILLQGAESVDAAFARVERGCAEDASQPQCVRYRFTAADLETIRDFVAAVQGASASVTG